MASTVQVQVVGRDGSTLIERPVNLEDLLTRQSNSVEIGEGVRVALGGAAAAADAYDDDWAVVKDMRDATAAQSAGNAEKVPMPTGKVDPAEWSAVASSSDPRVDYTKMEPLDITPPAKKFHPIPLTFHSMLSYSDGASANRMIVYGGRTGRGEEQNEVYEFTLATGSWRRLETSQQQCNGVFGHGCAIDGTRMYVLGGFGTGGTPVSKVALQGQHELNRYELLVSKNRRKPSAPHTFGILPMLQQLNLTRFSWRRIPMGHSLHIAAHTVVCYNGIIYSFGGVDERMHVSNSLFAIAPSTGEVRLLRREGPSPAARFLHTAVVYHDWMIVFGGCDANNEVLSDTWAFNFSTELWEELPTVGGAGRFGHGCCLLGSRMLVTGGYGGWIDDEGAEPSKAFLELNLTPIKEQFLWKGLPTKGSLPNGVAFGAAAPSGGGTSLMYFGGMVLKGSGATAYRDDDANSDHSSGTSSAASTPRGKRSAKKQRSDTGLQPCGGVFLARFPDRPKTRASSSARRETLSGDPDELSASTKAFLKRQEDFIVKRDFQAEQTERQRSLAIKESADANLYLKAAEVDEILSAVDKTIDQLGAYDMPGMPDTVPDKAARILHVDESKGLLRQARDVLKSMIPKSTVGSVKSKTHRKMDGAPEEHGGAKPFRRVVVMALVNQVRRHMTELNSLTFGNYKWEQKEEYMAFAKSCEREVNNFVGTMNSIRDAYIQHRLKLLEDGAKRRDQVMTRLRNEIATERKKKLNDGLAKRTHFKASTSDRDKEIPLERASVELWSDALNKAIAATKDFTEFCASRSAPNDIPQHAFSSQIASASSQLANDARDILNAFTEFSASELKEGADPLLVSYRRFVSFEDGVSPKLQAIDAQMKRIGSLPVASPEGPTADEKVASEGCKRFVVSCTNVTRRCRAALQAMSSSFLSYVPPAPRRVDALRSSMPSQGSARLGSLTTAPVDAQITSVQRRVVAVEKPASAAVSRRVVPAAVQRVEEPTLQYEEPAVAVHVLAEPFPSSFGHPSRRSLMPSWGGPFVPHNHEGFAIPQAHTDSITPNHFDFYQDYRPSHSTTTSGQQNAPLLSIATALPPTPILVVNHQPPLPQAPPAPEPQAKVVEMHLACISPPVEAPPVPPPVPSVQSFHTTVSGQVAAEVPRAVPCAATAALHAAPAATPSVYSHSYAVAQFNYPPSSHGRPHTPAQCPGAPFNPEASRDRQMFRGRLTPGERSILMNRQLNAMW